MDITLTQFGIICAILSNLGVVGLFSFFLKRLVSNIDSKVTKEELEVIEDKLDENFEQDAKRDNKLDTLIQEVTKLCEQMKQVTNRTDTRFSSCGEHSKQITRMETNIENLDKRLTKLENSN